MDSITFVYDMINQQATYLVRNADSITLDRMHIVAKAHFAEKYAVITLKESDIRYLNKLL